MFNNVPSELTNLVHMGLVTPLCTERAILGNRTGR